AGGSEQIGRIPDTPVVNEAVDECEDQHGRASGKPATNSGGVGINFKRQSRPMPLFTNLQMPYFATRHHRFHSLWPHGHGLVGLARQDFAEPIYESRDEAEC